MIAFLLAALFLVGLILVVAGMLLLVLAGRGKVRAGGVIIIGPLPILVATDKETAKLAVALTLAALAFFALIVAVYAGWMKP